MIIASGEGERWDKTSGSGASGSGVAVISAFRLVLLSLHLPNGRLLLHRSVSQTVRDPCLLQVTKLCQGTRQQLYTRRFPHIKSCFIAL